MLSYPRLLTGLLLLLALSCSRAGAPTAPALASYYPIQDGKYRVYRVTDSTFTTSGVRVHLFKQRELTMGLDTNLRGEALSRLLLDSTSSTSDTNFIPYQTWQQQDDGKQVEVWQGNTPVIVLSAPLLRSTQWNGNLYNNNGIQLFSYLNLDSMLVVQGQSYPHCVLVQQRRISNSEQLRVTTLEAYAPGLGKVLRYDSYLKYNLGAQLILSTDSYVHKEELLMHN